MKHYVAQHSCLVGVTKSKRVTAKVVTNIFSDIIVGMPFIRPRHLKTLVRKNLRVFISSKVCRNAKAMVLKNIQEQFMEDFLVLNNYVA